jgi:hypothetical protein
MGPVGGAKGWEVFLFDTHNLKIPNLFERERSFAAPKRGWLGHHTPEVKPEGQG